MCSRSKRGGDIMSAQVIRDQNDRVATVKAQLHEQRGNRRHVACVK